MSDQERFRRADERFEQAHREDPERVRIDGEETPFAVHYHRRLAHWVGLTTSEPSEALRLAARCQHIRRWTLARRDFPEGPEGYKKWRSTLARQHADDAAEILKDVGYPEDVVARVGSLLVKKGLRSDAEVQAFEDAICLVFLENQLADFSEKHTEDKLIDILRKTWRKMGPRGRELAQTLAADLPQSARDLLTRALDSSAG